MARLVLSRKVGEIFSIGEYAQVKILEVKDKDGNKVIRVRIKAHPSISVSKTENLKQKKDETSASENQDQNK